MMGWEIGMMARRKLLKSVQPWAAMALIGASILSLASGQSPVRAEAQAPAIPACRNLLAAENRMPPHLHFVRCQLRPDKQGKPIEALYHVRGDHAVQVEARLIRVAGLNRLKRSCCRWDSAPGGFRGADGGSYSITMMSQDTSVQSRRHWRQIEQFEVAVTRATEEI